ncbi:MAG TPA: MFS transporter, partial [Acidobacteriota bacterium]|nr:MFS transporter [Acidobacteriota bacterium]
MTGYSTYRQIPVLFGALFVASVDNQVLIPLLPVLQQDLGTSVERLGLVFSAYALSAAVLNFFFGPL